MKYRLKPGAESFDVVDGPFAGRKYRRGKAYTEADIPPGEKKKFEPVSGAKPGKVADKPAKPKK